MRRVATFMRGSRIVTVPRDGTKPLHERIFAVTLLNSGRLKLLAVTPEADYEEWMNHAYPSNWLVGYDKEEVIYEQRLYDIQRLPCLYLLDKNKRVLLKEADYDRLCKYLSENYSLFER